MAADTARATRAAGGSDQAAHAAGPGRLELFRLAFGLTGPPSYLSPAFRGWWAGELDRQAAGGLVLLDSADRTARRLLRSGAADEADVLVVLASERKRDVSARALARRLMRRGPRPRLPPSAVEQRLPSERVTLRLRFEETTPTAPDSYGVDEGSASESGIGYLVSREPAFRGGIWPRLRTELDADEMRVRRIELRTRGAAVILASVLRAEQERPVVIRIVADGALQPVVRRNHVRLNELRSLLRSGPELLQLLPEPLVETKVDGVLVLVESMLHGTLAWQLARTPVESSIHAGAVAFLENLRARTTRPIQPSNVDAWLREDTDLLDRSGFVRGDIAVRLRDAITQMALATPRIGHGYTSHGDFGYGNILVDRTDGGLSGVIDWDTARTIDAPGIDRVNLEIQRERGAGRDDAFDRAVRAVWSARHAEPELGRDPDLARTLFGYAVARYVLRSLRYPAVYRAEERGFRRALDWLATEGAAR